MHYGVCLNSVESPSPNVFIPPPQKKNLQYTLPTSTYSVYVTAWAKLGTAFTDVGRWLNEVSGERKRGNAVNAVVDNNRHIRPRAPIVTPPGYRVNIIPTPIEYTHSLFGS